MQQVDVDELLGPDYIAPWDVAAAVELFARAVRRLGNVPWVVSLAIPLHSSAVLVTHPPQRTTLADDLSRYNPPGLYVMAPSLFVSPWSFEEYRRPLDASPPLNAPHGTNVRYVCFRSPRGATEGWEWERALWVDRWPVASGGGPEAVEPSG